MNVELTELEASMLQEALSHYLDVYDTDEHWENLWRKLRGEGPLPKAEFRFGVGMADTDYGPYVFVDGPNDYHFTRVSGRL